MPAFDLAGANPILVSLKDSHPAPPDLSCPIVGTCRFGPGALSLPEPSLPTMRAASVLLLETIMDHHPAPTVVCELRKVLIAFPLSLTCHTLTNGFVAGILIRILWAFAQFRSSAIRYRADHQPAQCERGEKGLLVWLGAHHNLL